MAEQYMQRLRIGCSFGPRKDGTGGTIGAFVDLPNERIGCIVSAHTILSDDQLLQCKGSEINYNFNNLMVYQPAPALVHIDDNVPFGCVSSVVYNPGMDDSTGVEVALITITDPNLYPDSGQFPKISIGYTEEIRLNFDHGIILTAVPDNVMSSTVFKYGAVTGLTSGAFSRPESAPIRRTLDLRPQDRLYNQIQICSMDPNKPFAKHGDAGALVMTTHIGDMNDMRALGILTGECLGHTFHVTPIWEILKALNLPLRLKSFANFLPMVTKDREEYPLSENETKRAIGGVLAVSRKKFQPHHQEKDELSQEADTSQPKIIDIETLVTQAREADFIFTKKSSIGNEQYIHTIEDSKRRSRMALPVRNKYGAIVHYTIPANCWPRYKYFQKRLLRLKPRFKRILDFVKLSERNLKRSAQYKDLLQLADKFLAKVRVIVLDDTCIRDEPLVSKLVIKEVGEIEKFVSIGSFPVDLDSYADIIVFVCTNESQEFLSRIEMSSSSKSNSTLSKMFFLYEESNFSYKFTELERSDFKIPIFGKETSTSTLSSMIQNTLEQSVVSVFDELAQFIITIESDTKGASQFDTQMNDTPTAVEQETLKIMETLQKLKFEIFGLLRKKGSKVELSTTVPSIPKISRELQIDLLKIPELIGCGIFFDQLVLHASQKFQKSSEQTITDLLEEYGYKDSYQIEIIEQIKETAFAQGNEINTRFTAIGKAQYIKEIDEEKDEIELSDSLVGTLGCFVNITERMEDGIYKNNLHGITCAHCIMFCNPEITIQDDTNNTIIAQRSEQVYSKNRFDIAAIKIKKKDYDKCDKALVDDDGEKSESWTFGKIFPEPYEDVYRFKSTSGITRGLIVANNYVSNQVEEKYKNLISEYKDSIIIVHEADFRRDANEQPDFCDSFSEIGDSGSIICLEDSENSVITVVALLHGSMIVEAKDTKARHKYSLAFPIKYSITKLERQFDDDCTIEPARNDDRNNEDTDLSNDENQFTNGTL